jgi:hypothetical protein
MKRSKQCSGSGIHNNGPPGSRSVILDYGSSLGCGSRSFIVKDLPYLTKYFFNCHYLTKYFFVTKKMARKDPELAGSVINWPLWIRICKEDLQFRGSGSVRNIYGSGTLFLRKYV